MADVERFIRETVDHLPPNHRCRVFLEVIARNVLGYNAREVPSGVEGFSAEAREALGKEGYVIYQLTGKSIRTLRENGLEIWSTCQDNPGIEDLPSRRTEVAINPDQFFLPESNGKTLAEQERMVKKFSRNLRKKIKGVKAILGKAPDYVEVAFIHLQTTNRYLFGEGDNFGKDTRTKTREVGECVVRVGAFSAKKNALMVGHGHPDFAWDDVWAAPLIVPV